MASLMFPSSCYESRWAVSCNPTLQLSLVPEDFSDRLHCWWPWHHPWGRWRQPLTIAVGVQQAVGPTLNVQWCLLERADSLSWEDEKEGEGVSLLSQLSPSVDAYVDPH